MGTNKIKRNDGYYDINNNNYDVLVLADKLRWKKAKKVKGMIARRLEKDCVVKSIEGKLNAREGQFVCRGVDTDDWWVQKEEAINKKYEIKEKYQKVVVFNGEKFSDFNLYSPKPDRAVLCCKMTKEFVVHASWGELKGKRNDFLIKPLDDELNPNPKDVWLVDRELFNATYQIKLF